MRREGSGNHQASLRGASFVRDSQDANAPTNARESVNNDRESCTQHVNRSDWEDGYRYGRSQATRACRYT